MDNMKYYNDSLAYDFAMFMPKEKEQTRDNIVVMPKQQKSRAAAKRLSPVVAVIMCVAFVLAGLCTNIALRIKINEINSQIRETEVAVNELHSEKTALEVEFQRRISFINLEDEATRLGMKKASKDSVTYIRVNDNNVAKNAEGTILTNK